MAMNVMTLKVYMPEHMHNSSSDARSSRTHQGVEQQQALLALVSAA